MSKWAISGLLLMVVGVVILGFQKISNLMGQEGSQEGSYESLCLVDLFEPDFFNWIDGITFLGVNNFLDMIVLAPVYILLFCVGGILLIISGFLKV
jgi:hypothetical protein